MLNTKKKNRTQQHEDSNKKERHIVSWTQEEDDLLREQIGIHGTENWPIIASKFKDKTTRQCRRRWYTYLNSDFKKGGWSPEEDVLLCEAQKIFGNRWTEIAKVVSGRTDNAVKNRFSTLCKKKAKYEALVKENKVAYINSNSKRALSHDTLNTDARADSATTPPKKMRKAHIPGVGDNQSLSYRSHIQGRETFDEQPRPPFSVLVQNVRNNHLASQNHVSDNADNCRNGQITTTGGIFLKKDDPKMTALMQQAELLTSLADKVNAENTDQSLENAWKVLQDFLTQSKDNGVFRYGIPDIDFQIEGFKELVEDIATNDEGSRTSWRQPDLCEESPASSEYSSGSTVSIHTTNYTTEEIQAENKKDKSGLEPANEDPENGLDECEKEFLSSVIISQVDELPKTESSTLQSCHDQITNAGIATALPNADFSSPVHVTPLFRSLAAAIPSPKFSESERSFLMKTLGMESFSPSSNANPSRPPPCKRALLQSL